PPAATRPAAASPRLAKIAVRRWEVRGTRISWIPKRAGCPRNPPESEPPRVYLAGRLLSQLSDDALEGRAGSAPVVCERHEDVVGVRRERQDVVLRVPGCGESVSEEGDLGTQVVGQLRRAVLPGDSLDEVQRGVHDRGTACGVPPHRVDDGADDLDEIDGGSVDAEHAVVVEPRGRRARSAREHR